MSFGNTFEKEKKYARKKYECAFSLSFDSLPLSRARKNFTPPLRFERRRCVGTFCEKGERDFEAATKKDFFFRVKVVVPRERERARDRIISSLSFFLLLESALFVSLSRVRGKRRCARALGSSSTSRRRAMMTKTVRELLTEIGTISERNNEVVLVLSSSFFFSLLFYVVWLSLHL